jgi:hypothetical protein
MTDADGKRLKKGEQVWVACVATNNLAVTYQRLGVVGSSRVGKDLRIKVAWVAWLCGSPKFSRCTPNQLVRATGQ